MAKSNKPKKGTDGFYHKQAYIGKADDGTRIYKRFKARTLADLTLQIAQYRADFDAGLIVRDDVTPALTLGEAMDRYIETCRVMSQADDFSHSTIPGYVSIRDHAFQDIINKRIDKITIDDIQTSLNKRLTTPSERTGKPISVKSVRNEFYLLKPVLDKYAPALNLKSIRLPKNKKKRPMLLENAEAPVILSEAYKMHPEFFVYTLLTMVAGLRPSEVYALKWRDLSASPMLALIDGQKLSYGEISVSRAKTMNEFRVYAEKSTKTEAGERVLTHDWTVFETIYSVLERGQDDEPLVKMNPRQQQYYWDKLRTALGLPASRRFYDLRHYHCSVMVAVGAPEDYIAADMGHSTIRMAHDVYIEIIGEKQRDINLQVANNSANLINEFRNATTMQRKAL